MLKKSEKIPRDAVHKTAMEFASKTLLRINKEYLEQYLTFRLASLPAEHGEVTVKTVEDWVLDSRIKSYDGEEVANWEHI